MDASQRHASDDDGDLHVALDAKHGGRVGDLYPHQVEGTRRLNEHKGAGYILASDMGCGKTRMVFQHLKDTKPLRTLVACGGMSRPEWRRQIELWEPSVFDYRIGRTGEEVREACAAIAERGGMLITSYALLKDVTGRFERVIADEGHRISNPDNSYSQHLRRIIEGYEETFFIPMTGTLAPDTIDDIWHICSLCEPGQWGQSIWAFRRRYMNEVDAPWMPSGKMFKGLRKDRAEELARRLSKFMYRVTQDEVMAHLPPLTISPAYYKPKRLKGFSWDDDAGMEALLLANVSQAMDTMVDIIEEAKPRKLVVFCALRQTVADAAGRLMAMGYEAVECTGAQTAEARQERIDSVRQNPCKSAIVATMDSIAESCDMTFVNGAIWLEQHWVHGVVDQSIGRLRRLSSTHPIWGRMIVGEGTRAQRQAEKFVREQSERNAIMKMSHGSNAMAAGMKQTERSDEDLLRDLLL